MPQKQEEIVKKLLTGWALDIILTMKEQVSLQEKENYLPTTLNPFRYKGEKLSSLRSVMFRAHDLEEDITRVGLSIGNLQNKRNQTLDRLSQTRSELNSQDSNTESSISCGLVYLKMLDELKELSPQQLFDFFKLCLKINTAIDQYGAAKQAKEGKSRLMLDAVVMLTNNRQADSELGRIIDKMLGEPPEWFKNQSDTWEKFVTLHANFTLYLNLNFITGIRNRSMSLPKYEKGLEDHKIYEGLTIEGEFPDWLLDLNGKIPTKEEAEQELEEDKAEHENIVRAYREVNQKGEYVINRTLDKFKKALVILRRKEKEVFPQIGNFPGFILFLKATGQRTEYPVDNETLLKMPASELTNYIKRHTLNPGKSREKAIRNFVESPEFLTNPEPIALFLERKLRDGNVMGNAQDTIDDNFIDRVTGICDDPPSSKVQDLRNHDKRTFRTLVYDLKPILDVLSPDIKSYLKDLMLDSKGSPIETIIWEIAILLSSSFKDGVPKDTKLNPIFIKDIKNFTSDLLIKYWDKLYQELQKSLQKDQKEETVSMPLIKDRQEQTASIETVRGREEALEEVQEIDAITEELGRGNLAGWEILYTTNRSTDPQHLKEIGGETMDEREDELKKFLIQERIGASIKPGSIIRAIEWLVAIPATIEYLRDKKEVNGNKFLKLKRGPVRIFYQLLPEEKRFIFFLHQKQQMSYPF